jgi:hypothetical protein
LFKPGSAYNATFRLRPTFAGEAVGSPLSNAMEEDSDQLGSSSWVLEYVTNATTEGVIVRKTWLGSHVQPTDNGDQMQPWLASTSLEQLLVSV